MNKKLTKNYNLLTKIKFFLTKHIMNLKLNNNNK
jgi:hypothetical protein